MTKKMKLITESEYNRYLKLSNQSAVAGEGEEPKRIVDKHEILESDSIPDDMKLILYQDLARRMYQKKYLDTKKPLLVETVVSKKTSVEDDSIVKVTLPLILHQVNTDHAKAIAEHMIEKGVTWDSHMEISIGDQRIPGSSIIELLRTLTAKKFTRLDIPGMSDIVNLFPQFGQPFNLFSTKIQNKFRSPTQGSPQQRTPEQANSHQGGRKRR
jgi:hypothetical protein